jgi:hypothetical protein
MQESLFTYSDKLKTYANTFYQNETLRKDTFKLKKDIYDLKQKYDPGLVPLNQFGPLELEQRQKLLFEISKLVWI